MLNSLKNINEGRIETSTYEKEGQTHYSTQINAQTVIFLGEKQVPTTQRGRDIDKHEHTLIKQNRDTVLPPDGDDIPF